MGITYYILSNSHSAKRPCSSTPLVRGDPTRPIAVFLDGLILPLLSILGLQISKYIPDVGKWSYTSDKAQVFVLILGAILNEIDQTWADNHSPGTRAWNMQWGSIAHRILLPLFILRFFTICLAAFDWRLKLPIWLRALSVLAVIVTIGGFIYGYIDFATK